MGREKQHNTAYFFTVTIVFAIVFVIAFFGTQFITKTGIFHVPGVVTYDESLTESEISLLQTIFTEDVKLDKNLHVTAENFTKHPELRENSYLTEVKVPVTSFYDSRNDTNQHEDFETIPIEELDHTKKLLSVDGEYYLDTFDGGAFYRVLTFESEAYDSEIKPLIADKFTKTYPTKDTVLTFAQTGVTALSRRMNAKLYQVGDANYFAEHIKDFLSSFDLTHTSNESSFTSAANSSNICSDPRFIDTLTAIGLDIVELTGNHNFDCGYQTAIDTIDIYEQNGIKHVGGGKNADDAATPLQISQKGTGITFLAYNQSTGGSTYGNTPGANQYYEERAASDIAAAKARGDFVIVDIQYYECNAYASTYEDPICDHADSSAGDQIGFFRHLIDLGADLVVGTAAHQPQTFELYGDGAIYYGLGNLFFDQSWWPGTTRSLVLAHYFHDGKLLQTKIVPTVYDGNLQTKLLEQETAAWLVERLASVRPNQ